MDFGGKKRTTSRSKTLKTPKVDLQERASPKTKKGRVPAPAGQVHPRSLTCRAMASVFDAILQAATGQRGERGGSRLDVWGSKTSGENL